MNTTVVENNVWGDILHSLRTRINQQTIETWFQPIQFEGLDPSQQVLCLRAPNQVVKDWVVSNYSGLLNQTLSEVALKGYSVGWVIDKKSIVPSEVSPVHLADVVPKPTPPVSAT